MDTTNNYLALHVEKTILGYVRLSRMMRTESAKESMLGAANALAKTFFGRSLRLSK
jgi:hypothetical protein